MFFFNDYKMIDGKFADVWSELQDLRRRVRELEDARDEERCIDINDICISDVVMAKHPEKGWIKACVMEKCLRNAFVVSSGKCFWTDKVRKIKE